MVIEYFIMPRQSGKTFKALMQLQRCDDDTAVLVCSNECNSKLVKSKAEYMYPPYVVGPNKRKYIVHAHKLKPFILGKNIKTIILDEYLYFNKKQKEEVIECLECCPNLETVYVYTTSDVLYWQSDITKSKLYLLGDEDVTKYLKGLDDCEKQKELKVIENINLTLLSNPNTHIHNYTVNETHVQERFFNLFNQDTSKYRTEICGQYLK